MNFEIETREEEPRSPRRPPVDYQSRGFRLRLMMLFGMLILVLVLMKEVRKPERWEWMGFDNRPANVDQEDAADQAPATGTAELSDADETSVQRPLPKLNQADERELPAISVDFWESVYGKLGVDRQRALFRLLRLMRTGHSVDLENTEQRVAYRELFELIKMRRDRYYTELIDRISFLDDKSDRKRSLNEQLFRSRDDWENQVRPAFEELLQGNEIKISQLKSVEALQRFLDSQALGQVVDGADMKRPAEGSAWLRCWERLDSERWVDPPQVTQIELMGQPMTYRGRPVEVAGWIRAARILRTDGNELGIEHLFELWLRPRDTNQAPYCVYVRELPPGFPELTPHLEEMNENVAVAGLFFKIRSYEGADGQVRSCPLILARTFAWNPVVTKQERKGWTPSWWVIAGFLVGMPLVATLLAWSVFRNTQTRRFEPGIQSRNQIASSLTQLKEDPEVKTDLDKIRDLEQRERE